MKSHAQRGWRRAVKTVVDRTAAGVGLVATAPLMAPIAGAIWATMGRPVLFSQERPGLDAKPIRVFKFRTMNDARDENGRLRPDADRLTRLGRFLRASSLDELPQLFNVLRGDLSLVGPRPLLMQYLQRYTHEQARRHEVMPGITGWSQINGRNAISWNEKLALDVWYVDHWSLLLDARILLRTALKVVAREGISQDGHVTMPEFMGSAETNGHARHT
jgi:lipopolysaccharide/colanic/teichoic acid biosynthesis glycosyltransferase